MSGPAETTQRDGCDGQPASGGVLRSALGWSFLNNLVGRVGSSLVGIALARVLIPEDYGVYAVCLVALAALLSMNELGVSLAVIRWPGDVGRIAPTVMTLALGSSAVLYLAIYLLAPAVAHALHAPTSTGVLRLLAVAVLIDAATAVPAGLMTRHFLQKLRLMIDSVAFVTVSSVSLVLALAGYGPWSLAWGNLAGNLVSAALICVWSPERFRPGFDRKVARELLAFGIPLAGASVLAFVMINLDYVVVGAVLGPTALGLYLLAFNLSSWPVNIFSAPVRRVAVPAFARLLEAGQPSGPAFTRAWTTLLLAAGPSALLLGLLGTQLVQVLYGPKWAAAAGLLPFLALLALVRVLSELTYDFLVAHARSRSNLLVQAVWVAALGPALYVGARVDGLRGVALAHAAAALLVAVPASAVVLRRAGVPLAGLVRPVCRIAAALAAVAVVVIVVTNVVPGGPGPELLAGGLAGLAAYCVAAYPMRGHVAGLRPARPAQDGLVDPPSELDLHPSLSHAKEMS